jgi:hypothetical protein
MRFRQGAAALIFMFGVALGTLGDVHTDRAPSFVGGYWILGADLHVHAFIGDGALAPWDMRREAVRRRLDVVALTNHNQMLPAWMDSWFPHGAGAPLVLHGEELTAPRYHLIALGIDRLLDWRQPASAAIDAVHRQGGVAVAAHPERKLAKAFDTEALMRLDGTERAHPMMLLDDESRQDLAEFYARARTVNPHVAPIGSTDFHVLAPLGLCRTFVLSPEISERAVLDSIRQGRTAACDEFGQAYGDPAIVRLVEDECRLDAGLTGAHRRGLNAVAMGCVWMGLFGLLFRGTEVGKLLPE